MLTTIAILDALDKGLNKAAKVAEKRAENVGQATFNRAIGQAARERYGLQEVPSKALSGHEKLDRLVDYLAARKVAESASKADKGKVAESASVKA